MRRKNLKKEIIKDDICLALVSLMKEKDFHEITIQEICTKSGYGRTTYYRYFDSNKENLILHLAKSIYTKEYKEKYPEMYPEKEGDVILQSVYEHRQFYLTLTKQNLDHLIFQIFFKEIGRKESENEILSYGKAFFAGGYFGITYQWILNGCVDTPDEIKMKFLGGFQYVQEQMDKKEQNES